MLRNAALHAAVLASPDDDSPRLVYAEWLMERGDPRGELIATQVALARSPDDPALIAREAELMTMHRERWVVSLPRVYQQFHRGFVERIAIDAADLARLGPVIEDACMRRVEVFRTRGEPLDHLIAQLDRMAVRHLRLHDGTLAAPVLARLLAAPAFARLEMLALVIITLDRTGLDALVAAELPALRDLALSACGLDATAMEAFASWRHPLTAFDVSLNRLGPGVIAPVLAAPPFRSLASLDLRATAIGTEDVLALVGLDLPLATLDLALCSIGTAGAMAIAAWPGAARLRSLGLADAGIGAEGIAALMASPYLAHGMTLALDGDLLGLDTRGSRWVGDIDLALAARFTIVIDGEPAY